MRFAFIVCGTLLALCLVPAFIDALQALDGHAAYFFNRGAGVSPVFDRLILLVADDEGRERIITLAAVWFLIAVWIAPLKDKSRLLGTFFYIAIVLVLYFLVDSLLDDVIVRKSPSYDYLRPFNNIGKILDVHVDVKDRRTFPNAEAMILLTMGFMLLRLGRLRGGWLSLGLGLTIPLLLCVAGVTWFTDIYFGSLPLAFLVSAVAVETPFKRLHGSLVDLSAAGVDEISRMARNALPIWRFRRLYWTSQNVFHMEVATKRFARRELAGLLLPEAEAESLPEPRLEVPLGGLRSVVRIATVAAAQAIIRAYPINRRMEAVQHVKASEFLQKYGVRVPLILKFIDSPKKYGAFFIVEEFVEGRSVRADDLTDGQISALAGELARLHHVRAEVWGPLDAPRTEDYANVLFRRIEKQIARAARSPFVAGRQADLPQLKEWFCSWKTRIEQVRQFSLVHGKLHRENCLFEPDGRLCLLDTTTLEWGVGAIDMAVVHFSQCAGRADLIEKLDSQYTSLLPEAHAAEYKALLPFYEAQFLLSQVQKSTKRLRRSHGGRHARILNQGAEWWNHLIHLVQTHPGPANDQPGTD